ncbi:uncharacterized protein [Atheta coriaria]|uniref:uncharacterized protein isoform X2 n=1 Tax=Dalotia coriaria TaxID=877792 RepID=UPI0031F42869
MSPELNGNQPVLPKRNKKNRKHASTSNIRQTFPMAACNVPYMNSYCTYPTAPSFAIHPEPMSLPIYPPSYHHYSSTPVYNSGGFNSHGMNAASMNTPSRMFPHKNFAPEECMSLPVVKDEVEEDPGQRRFSDPGVPNDSDSGSENESMFQYLTHQVNVLQESNRQLMREVTELRMELNILKQQQMHSNNFDRDYEPGMISDFIKEIRDAARIREDALLAKVKHIVEEKQFSDSQLQMASEKKHHNDRIAKLEEQMKHMNFTTTSGLATMANIGNNSLRVGLGAAGEDMSLPSTSISLSEENSIAHSLAANRQVCELEREVLQLRREVQDSRAKKEESDNKIMLV